ncbi:hypothetical protein BGX29_001546, partial [Mortierella sp. GBA35]
MTYDPDNPSNRLLPWSTVFVKSNTNPASPTDLSWSVVSRIETAMLLEAEFNFSGNDISCAISTQGVFTVFLHIGSKAGIGIRYDPAGTMDPKYNVKGAWINMVVDPKYLWTDDFMQQALGYVSNGSTNVLVHVIFSEAANMLNVAMVHDATNTVTGTGAWALSFNTTQVFGCSSQLSAAWFIYFNHNTLTLICGLLVRTHYYSIKDPNNAVSTGPPTNFTADISQTKYIVPIGDGIGASSFSLMKILSYTNVLGNENGSKYARRKEITVADTVGINNGLPRPPTSSTSGGNGGNSSPTNSSQGSSASVGVIVGVIVGLVALAGLTFFIIKKRRTSQNKGTATAVAATAASFKTELPLDRPENYTPPQQLGQNGEPNYDTTGQYLATSYPMGLNEPTTILPMAPISSAPQQQTYQDRMAGLQLSSHPRPNFVTSSQDGQHSDISAGVPGSTAVPWRPTPFVPPARFDGITEMPSSSVGYYSPAATASSSATAQSSHGPQTYADGYAVPSATAQSSRGPQTFADADEVPMV